MISVNNLSFYFGGRPLYENTSLHIKPKDRIGLIGANGTGKSTLLRLIVGEYSPDNGDISKSNDCTIGFLNQDLLSYQSTDPILKVAMQAFERQMFLQEEIEKTLALMESNYEDHLVDKLTKLQEEFGMLDGYSIQSKAEEILEGLGFSTKDLQRPLKEFSGGWRMRVMLAKLLLMNPSLLLLDEPTNHLDMPSIQWIEEYLENYEGAIITVSHDRLFLDNVSDIIVEVSNCKLNYYPGNYSFYLEEKATRKEIQKNAFENQQAHIRQTERFIQRFRAKATKARQVQSRVKALQRLEKIEDVVDENAKINFKFNFGTQSGKNVLELKSISKAYGELTILNQANALIERGDKIALIGANGKGKSTMLRIIAGTETVSGERIIGHNVNLAFFAQHQLESLNLNNTILEELQQSGSQKSEMELRSILGCFLFSDEDVFKKIKVLSGGEKSRVALAKVLISEANFLLLDEPTNHLDLQSVNILIHALNQYQGTYVVVSHDRHFVAQIANKIWYIENQLIKEYPGTYEEYEIWREENPQAAQQSTTKKSEEKTPAKPVTKNSSPSLSKMIAQVESEISLLEQRLLEMDLALSDEKTFTNPELLKTLQHKREKIQNELNERQEKWFELLEKTEQ